MPVDEVQIGRYRSLYDVTFTPGKFTVLVGPNNAGKTNLVEAIEFLADTYRYGLETAVTRKGGIENIAFRRMRRTKSPVTFRVTVTLPADAGAIFVPRSTGRPPKTAHYKVIHSFSIAAIGQAIEAPFKVAAEDFDVYAMTSRRSAHILELHRTADKGLSASFPDRRAPKWAGGALFPFDDRNFLERINTGLQPTALLASPSTYYSVLFSLARDVGSARLFQLSPIEARRSGVPTPNPDLDRYGGNLPAFVNQMRKENRLEWAQVLEAMRSVVPDLEDVQTAFTPDRRLTLEFKERGVGRPWTAEEMSDGTIQSLALFSVLKRATTRLALIEEPENSLHPWVVRQFVELCREVSADHQIVVTTHSPALIAYLDPREITLVWREQGRTRVQPLVDADSDVLAMWQQGDLSSFEILDTGVVREAVPGGKL
jgi:predicted ATPase